MVFTAHDTLDTHSVKYIARRNLLSQISDDYSEHYEEEGKIKSPTGNISPESLRKHGRIRVVRAKSCFVLKLGS
jgi:hypothetical protein